MKRIQHTIKYSIFFLLLLIIYSCEKRYLPLNAYHNIETLAVTEGPRFSAKVFKTEGAEIIDHGFVINSVIEIIDHGFVINTIDYIPQKISLGALEETKEFSHINKHYMVAGQLYFVKGYVTTKDYTAYGNEVEFTSHSTTIVLNDFNPKSAYAQDTVTITGTDFSPYCNAFEVYFGDVQAKTIDCSDESIRVLVPSNTPLSPVIIYLRLPMYQWSDNHNRFTLLTP